MAEILKRNGKKVPYDGEKIIVAIEKAMCEVGASQKDIATKIEKEIYELLSKDSQLWTVERISDQVEVALMENKLFAAAKAYILYREVRSKERDIDIPSYKNLSKEFLNKYESQAFCLFAEDGYLKKVEENIGGKPVLEQ